VVLRRPVDSLYVCYTTRLSPKSVCAGRRHVRRATWHAQLLRPCLFVGCNQFPPISNSITLKWLVGDSLSCPPQPQWELQRRCVEYDALRTVCREMKRGYAPQHYRVRKIKYSLILFPIFSATIWNNTVKLFFFTFISARNFFKYGELFNSTHFFTARRYA